MSSTKVPPSLVGGVVTLAGTGTIPVDASLGDLFDIPATTDFTVGAATNMSDGQKIFFRIQHIGGGRLATWNAIYDWGTGGAPTLTAVAGKTDICGGRYCARTGKVMMFPAALGYAA